MKFYTYHLICAFVIFAHGYISAQEESFYVESNVDTAYIGEMIKIQFVMSNMQGEISRPSWHDSFEVVGSTGSFSQTSIISNEVTSKSGLSYHIRPTQSGVFPIEGRCIKGDGKEVNHVFHLIVKDGIREEVIEDETFKRISPFERSEPEPYKKKRKIYRL